MSEFSEYIFQVFLEWERNLPEKRSTYRKFASWLSENSLDITISESLFSAWIKGKYDPSDKYHYVLVEKLGSEVADILGFDPPDPLLQELTRHWSEINDESKDQIAQIIAPYTAEKKKRRGDTDELRPTTADQAS